MKEIARMEKIFSWTFLVFTLYKEINFGDFIFQTCILAIINNYNDSKFLEDVPNNMLVIC